MVKVLNETVYEIAALDKFNWRPFVPSLEDATKIEMLIKYLNDKTIHNPMFFTEVSKEDLKEFESKNTKCWMKMVELRNSALCLVCSGRYNVFVFRNKANINEHSCNIILDECWEVIETANR